MMELLPYIFIGLFGSVGTFLFLTIITEGFTKQPFRHGVEHE